MRRRLWSLLVVAALLAVVMVATVQAGMMCDAAAYFEFKSPALNSHCLIEWLWELGFI